MWINDATSPWVVTTTQPNTGTYCAKSTNTGMFSNSKISLAVNLPTSCVVSYYARVSCFPLNGCGFFIDNVQYGETLKDEVPWTRYTVAIGPGNHILEWKYANQLAEGEYDNAFYIDDITVGNTYSIYRANCDGSNAELIASNIADANYVDYGWEALPIGQYKYGISTDGGNTIAWSDCLDKDVMVVDENNAMDIKVYPNPTNDILFVETVCTPSLPAGKKSSTFVKNIFLRARRLLTFTVKISTSCPHSPLLCARNLDKEVLSLYGLKADASEAEMVGKLFEMIG
jgi:hypothetical protein